MAKSFSLNLLSLKKVNRNIIQVHGQVCRHPIF